MSSQTKPSFQKLGHSEDGTGIYGISHPLFTEVRMYPETRFSEGEWICYLPYEGDGYRTAGSSRRQAVAGMIRLAQHDADGVRSMNFFYSEQERLRSVSKIGTLTTAEHALLGGMENADDTVREGGVVDQSVEYWNLAVSGYQSNMDELTEGERKFAEQYNVADMARCSICGEPMETETEICGTCQQQIAQDEIADAKEALRVAYEASKDAYAAYKVDGTQESLKVWSAACAVEGGADYELRRLIRKHS